ncbi:NACHT domain-containing protein [Trichoderma gamsii]|uniref:NACHT domain-containing protein n=1 Tax=Trichoderma gamsii TaxID=398673 RepID=A0A2P4ZXN7_9HYPO|nr:NACHT domain-containing protein [Trichoderma gamsii]PON29052.1 NACHT domain-containing protein [Trichoderma gamsii]
MFLYARLVLDYLSTNVFYNYEEIKASVNQLPDKISDLSVIRRVPIRHANTDGPSSYRQILTQVLIHLDHRSLNRIKCVLGWIAFAKRPLKRLEFLSAVTFSAGDPKVAHLAPQYILDICAPLIDERHDTTLTFIHASVKEFLQTPTCSLSIDEQAARQEHGVAVITCLFSGLDIFDKSYNKFARYLRVVKGVHGLHVYATEYWTDYLLSSAKYTSGLEGDSTMFSLACQMAEKLNLTAGTSTIEHFEAKSSVHDEILTCLQKYPVLYQQVRVALGARSIRRLEHELLQISAVDGTSCSSPLPPVLDGISAMLAVYQETVRSILDQSDHPGISAEELELFKSQFRTSAFTCRLKSCPRATLGFEEEKSCLEHELAHVQKVRCTNPDCHFPPFASAQALKNHVNKHHNSAPKPRSIRDILTSRAIRSIPACHNDERYKNKQRMPAKVISLPYNSKTRDDRVQIAHEGLRDVSLRKGSAEGGKRASHLLADDANQQQHRLAQHERVGNRIGRIKRSLGDDSDEASDDDQDEGLNVSLYSIITNFMALPHHPLFQTISMPSTFKTWQDFWTWMNSSPEITKHVESFAYIQYRQFKRKLQVEKVFSPGQSLFVVPKLEIEHLRKYALWRNESDDTIAKAIIQTKGIVWKKMQEDELQSWGKSLETPALPSAGTISL